MSEMVEVVRCRDCIYYRTNVYISANRHDITTDWCGINGTTTQADGYCHKGERNAKAI